MAEILDNKESFSRIDKSGMYEKAYSIPEMMEQTWKNVKGQVSKDLGTIDNVIISGMGGSAISGDIIAGAYSDKLRVPVIVNRGYEIPNFSAERTLFIAVSYSGNTEETLSAFDKAMKIKCNAVAISSGGKLEEQAKALGVPHIKLPGGSPPRAALGYILPAILSVFQSAKLCTNMDDNLIEAVMVMKKAREKYSIDQRTKDNEVKQLAVRMQGKIPVIMSCVDTTFPAGMRLKTQLNENSKVTAIHITFPELNHNDIVNFSVLKPAEHRYFAVVLRDNNDSERIKKRIEITKSLVSGSLGGFNEITPHGKSKLTRLLSLVLYADLLSVYLGVLLGNDPTPVTIIEQLKKEMSR